MARISLPEIPLPAQGSGAALKLAHKHGGKFSRDIAHLRWAGLTNLEDLFRLVRGWLEERGYLFIDSSFKYKGDKREIIWQASKEITEYITYQIAIDWKIRDIKDVEVVKDGEKLTMQQCRIILDMQSTLEADPNKRFKGSAFLQSLQDFMHRYIIKKDLQAIYLNQMYYSHLKLYRAIQDFLGMTSKAR